MPEFLYAEMSFLVARFNPKDRGHSKARRFMESLALREQPPRHLVTSEYSSD